jgi:hypothetical protein
MVVGGTNPKIHRLASRCRSKGVATIRLGDRGVAALCSRVDGRDLRPAPKILMSSRIDHVPTVRVVTCAGIRRRHGAALAAVSIIRL